MRDPQGIVEAAYAAALDDDLWAGWADRLSESFSAQGSMFWMVDTARVQVRRSHVHFEKGDVARVLDEYGQGFVDLDFRLRKVAHSAVSEIFSDDDIVLDNPRDREFARWQLDRVKTCHYLAGTVALPSDLKVGFSVHRTAEAGPFSTAEKAALHGIFRQVSSAIRLGVDHQNLLQAAWWDGVHSGSADAAFLLDEEGKVIRTSPRAEALIRENVMSLRQGHLACRHSADSDRLNRIVAAATQASGAVSGCLSLAGDPDRACRVLVMPLARERRFLAPFEAAAIVRIVDESRTSRISQTLLKDLYGLTPSESRLAAALAEGHSVTTAAEAFGVSVLTVRGQLKSVFLKTGINRQKDLVLRLNSYRS